MYKSIPVRKGLCLRSASTKCARRGTLFPEAGRYSPVPHEEQGPQHSRTKSPEVKESPRPFSKCSCADLPIGRLGHQPGGDSQDRARYPRGFRQRSRETFQGPGA